LARAAPPVVRSDAAHAWEMNRGPGPATIIRNGKTRKIPGAKNSPWSL
jgi:hypothetical protein